MRFTLSWLKNHLDTTSTLDKICEVLPQLGFPIARVDQIGEGLEVAFIQETAPHPQADRLKVCRVETHKGIQQIVCGAPNARQGIKVALAHPGALIPATRLVLKASKIRGVESAGMLCSARELQVGDEADGILELPSDIEIGTPIWDIFPCLQPVVDLEITPNRGDLYSLRGIAREIAAAGLGFLKPAPQIEPLPYQQEPIAPLEGFCPFLTLCPIRDVNLRATPEFFQNALRAVGIKPTELLPVDISSYVLHDQGQPTHVFDLEAIKGSVTVGLSQGGESFEALNGCTYTLPTGILVLKDCAGIISLAGLIGGQRTACRPETTHLLVESAYFSPLPLAKGGQALGICTEARTRFERGVDRAGVLDGLHHVVDHIVRHTGGRPEPVQIYGAPPPQPEPLALSLQKLKTLGGASVHAQTSKQILQDLGFSPRIAEEHIYVTPPAWRHDIDGEADLVEEVMRVWGYDNISPVEFTARPQARFLTPEQSQVHHIKKLLASRGLNEVITWSFLSPKQAEFFGGATPELTLQNPISQDLSIMRPHIAPHLINILKQHLDRSSEIHGIFEVGPVYTPPQQQSLCVTGLLLLRSAPTWKDQKLPDIFDAKAHAEAVLKLCGVSSVQVKPQGPAWYHPGRRGAWMQGHKTLGFFGQLHPKLLQNLGVEHTCAGFEIFLNALPPRRRNVPRRALKLSPYQPVTRDIAFIVKRSVLSITVIQALYKARCPLLKDLAVFDYFQDQNVLGSDYYSLGVRFFLQSDTTTLQESDIEDTVKTMIQAVNRETGATVRDGCTSVSAKKLNNTQ